MCLLIALWFGMINAVSTGGGGGEAPICEQGPEQSLQELVFGIQNST